MNCPFKTCKENYHSSAHTQTHTHRAPSPTSSSGPVTISCSLLLLFSEVRAVCLLRGPSADSRCRTTPAPPARPNLSRYQPPPPQLQACLLKGTLPLEIMERLWQIVDGSICQTSSRRKDGVGEIPCPPGSNASHDL